MLRSSMDMPAGSWNCPGFAAAGPEIIQQTPRRAEHLHRVEQRVHEVDVAVGVCGDSLGAVQCSGLDFPVGRKRRRTRRRGSGLHAEIHGIHDVQPSGRERERRGKVEFAWPVAAFADGADQRAIEPNTSTWWRRVSVR